MKVKQKIVSEIFDYFLNGHGIQSTTEYFNEVYAHIKKMDLSIEYEGHNYKGINDYTYDFSITDMIIEDMCSVDFKVSTITAESTLFSKGDSEELKSFP